MDDEEILRCLERNSSNKIVLEFTKELFKEEFMGVSNTNKVYDGLIAKYGGKWNEVGIY